MAKGLRFRFKVVGNEIVNWTVSFVAPMKILDHQGIYYLVHVGGGHYTSGQNRIYASPYYYLLREDQNLNDHFVTILQEYEITRHTQKEARVQAYETYHKLLAGWMGDPVDEWVIFEQAGNYSFLHIAFRDPSGKLLVDKNGNEAVTFTIDDNIRIIKHNATLEEFLSLTAAVNKVERKFQDLAGQIKQERKALDDELVRARDARDLEIERLKEEILKP